MECGMRLAGFDNLNERGAQCSSRSLQFATKRAKVCEHAHVRDGKLVDGLSKTVGSSQF